jgi:small subunit ribosomal protein S4
MLRTDSEKEIKMAVDKTPVLKRCRSLDLDPTFLGYDKKSKRTLNRRSRKMSEYGTQLREKQKAKFIYGVLEKPFRNYYDKADRMKGMTGENLMVMLECRLDSVVFRMGFARTRREARQIVDHKHILVNGKCINIPSYEVKAGDVVEVKESSRSMQRFKDIAEVTGGRTTPEWMAVDKENMKGTINSLPKREQIDVPVDEMQIVELYSK